MCIRDRLYRSRWTVDAIKGGRESAICTIRSSTDATRDHIGAFEEYYIQRRSGIPHGVHKGVGGDTERILRKRRGKPVSYTHLDVYKRQKFRSWHND